MLGWFLRRVKKVWFLLFKNLIIEDNLLEINFIKNFKSEKGKMIMGKRFALLVDNEEDFLEIEEGVKIFQDARNKGIFSCGTVDMCSIFGDPGGLDYILSGYTQTGIDVVVVVSKMDSARIINSILRNEYKNEKIQVVPIILGKSESGLTQIFKEIVSGKLPEIKNSKFIKAKKLTFYEAMKLLPKK